MQLYRNIIVLDMSIRLYNNSMQTIFYIRSLIPISWLKFLNAVVTLRFDCGTLGIEVWYTWCFKTFQGKICSGLARKVLQANVVNDIFQFDDSETNDAK